MISTLVASMGQAQKAWQISSAAWAADCTKRSAFIRNGLRVCAVAVMLSPTTALAETVHQQAVYGVYAGGVRVVDAKMELDYTPDDRYMVDFKAGTRGILGLMAPWSGGFKTEGRVVNNTYLPTTHVSTSVWRDDTETKTYAYNNDGSFKDLTTLYTHKKPRTHVPDAELTVGTTDALSATLAIMRAVSLGAECEGSADVFDGKRSYTLQFRHMGNVMLESSRYNAYSGVAAECTAEVIPLKGRWHEKPRGWLSIQEQGRNKGTMPTVWMAQVRDGATAIPVKVRVKTDYGTMFMQMMDYLSGDVSLSHK